MPTSTVTAAPALRDGMKTAAVTAIDDTSVQIELGFPWPQNARDIVAVGGVHSVQDTATVGTLRTRDETLHLEVLISVFRPGGQEAEKIASDRAYELLGKIAHYCRMTDPTVGGAVRECLLAEHDMDSEPFSDDTADGRLVAVLATFQAKARIRN